MSAGVVFLIFGGIMIFVPLFAPADWHMLALAKIVISSVGAILAFTGACLIVITKLYRKASAEEAFVRTGMNGSKVIIDGGCLVIPVLHQVIPVSLNTMKLEVKRSGVDALITGDKLRADVIAEFYIRVKAVNDDITAAARSLGDKSLNTSQVTELVEQKLVSALRSVAAKANLEELNSEREKFAIDVGNAVRNDLKENGLTLETVTVSMLDQTDITHLKPDNVFDAEGRKRIAEITSANKILENQFTRDAEQSIAGKNTETRQKVAEQEFLQKQADAKRDANTAMAIAEQAKAASVFQAEQSLLTRQAQLATEQQVGQRDAEKDKEIRLAKIAADQAAKTAEVVQAQAVEVAGRNKEIAIANAEQQRAAAQALQLQTEQVRVAEKQAVVTVEEVKTADRTRQVEVIAAEKEAAVQKTGQFMQADIQAYQVDKVAQGKLAAAQKDAEAVRVKATADKDASVLRAEGDQAVQMVPVNVTNAEVTVEARRQTEAETARVAVLTQELTAKDAHTEVSVRLQQILALLKAVEAIGTAQAEAVGKGLSQAQMTFFGDPGMLEKFSTRFGAGVSVNALLEGLLGGGNGHSALEGLGGVLSPLLSKVLGKGKSTDEEDEQLDPAKLIEGLEALAISNPKLKGMIDKVRSALAPTQEPTPPQA